MGNLDDNALLTRQELLELNMRKQDALKKSTARRRTYIDNEFGDGSFSGIFSLFFSKTAFKHGWEKEENLHRDPQNQIEVTKDPTNKIYAFAIITSVIITAALGGWIAATLGGGLAIVGGVFGGAAIGGLLGVIDGYFEAGKIKREITEGRDATKQAVHEIKQDGRQKAVIQKNNELELKLEKLEQKLNERSNSKESSIQKHLEKGAANDSSSFVEKYQASKQNQNQLQSVAK